MIPWLADNSLLIAVNGTETPVRLREPLDPINALTQERHRLFLWILLALGAFLALGLLAANHSKFDSGTTKRISRLRMNLAQSLGPFRPMEGRLAGPFGYKGFEKSSVPYVDRKLVHAVERRYQAEQSVEAAADLALLKIIARKYREALKILAPFHSQLDGYPLELSDLSAVHLEIYRQEQEPAHLLLALEFADRAVAADPLLTEARFNLALALSRLSLLTSASHEWETFIASEGDPNWVKEAKLRLRDVRKIEARQGKELTSADLISWADSAEDGEDIKNIVSSDVRSVRIFLESDLPFLWAASFLKGDSSGADRALDVMDVISGALKLESGDPFTSRLSENINHIKSSRSTNLASLAQGIIGYKEGRDLYNKGAYKEALPLLLEAQRKLTFVGSPLALRAYFTASCTLHYMSATQQAVDGFSAIEIEAAREEYWSLHGEALWMLGLSAMARRNPTDAQAFYLKARDAFFHGKDASGVAGIDNLLAELFDLQDAESEAWRHRLKAIDESREISDPQRLYQIYTVAARACIQKGQTYLAPYFQAEAIRQAARLKNPAAQVTALVRIAQYYIRLNRNELAESEVVLAGTIIKGMTPSFLRERSTVDLLMAEAQIESQPKDTISILNSAIETSERIGYNDNLHTLYYLRALAHREGGDSNRAYGDLRVAIRLVEEWQTNLPHGIRRLADLEESRTIFSHMVTWQIADSPEEAWEFAEHWRNFMLRSLSLVGEGGYEPNVASNDRCCSLASLAKGLPPEAVLVSYLFSEADLYIWVADGNGIRIWRKVKPNTVGRDLAVLQSSLIRGVWSREAKVASESLYRILIKPVSDYIKTGKRLILVPDGILHSVPFAALMNEGTGRFLLEDAVISVVPSAEIYLRAVANSRRLQRFTRQSAFVVANPRCEREEFSFLESLPEAESEAKEVAMIYEDGRMVAGAKAERDVFLYEAPNYNVIHYAGHALVGTESPSLSGLVLCSSGNNGRGTVDVEDIIRIPFRKTRLVVLSGCGTARNYAGDLQAPGSLAHSFLIAGVPSVIGSLWPVKDRASLVLMQNFHRNIVAGLAPVVALRNAQLAALKEDQSSRSTSFYWAALQLIGN